MIKLRITVLIGICICQFWTFAAFDQQNRGARSAGMGNASTGLRDFWSIYNNQAGLVFLKGTTFGISVHNHYLVNELNRGSLCLEIPLRKAGVIGLTIDDFGISVYRENVIGLAYARSFGTGFSVGLKLNYMRITYAGDYGDKNYVGFDLGLMYQAKPGLTFACHTSNPFAVNIPSTGEERLPSRIALGMAHQISREIILSLECEKITSRKPRFKTGIEYTVNEKIFLRAGIMTSPFQFAFGFGYKLGNIIIDIASAYHRFLGFSPQLSIHYSIPKKH